MKREHLDTKEHTIRRVWTVEDIPVLEAAVTLPEPQHTNDACTRRIRRYYRLQSRAFLRYCELQLYPAAAAAHRAALSVSAPLQVSRAELTYRITRNGGGLWSLYTQLRQSTPTEKLYLRRWGDTWDLHSGYLLPAAAFFPPHSGWKGQLLHLAEERIRQQEAAGIARYHPHYRRALRRHFDARNYYLSDEGLVFFYPMYAIAPAEERIPAFCMPPGVQMPGKGELLPSEDACSN